MKSCQSRSVSEQKKQRDFRATTPTQLLELGLVCKPCHEVSTAAGVWDVGFDICWTTAAAGRMPDLKRGTVWFKDCMRQSCFPFLSLQTEISAGWNGIKKALRWSPVRDGGSMQKTACLSWRIRLS